MIQLLTWPNGWHAYQRQFASALLEHDIQVREGDAFSNDALKAAAGQIDGIICQWAEHLWHSDSKWRALRLAAVVARYCCSLAKRLARSSFGRKAFI